MNRAFWKGWAFGLATVAGGFYLDEVQTRFSVTHMKWKPELKVPVVMVSIGVNTINVHTRKGPGVRYSRTNLDRLSPPLPIGVWPKPTPRQESNPS